MELQSLFGDKKKILFCAHPEYYDYLHYIQFKKDGTFYLIDGGGQCVNGEYEGQYTSNDKTIVFDYEYSINLYYNESDEEEYDPFSQNTKGLTKIDHQVLCNYKLVKEKKEHVGGYTGKEVFTTNYSLYLDRTPLYISHRQDNLFNMIVDNSFPTTFYSEMQ